MPNTPPFTLTNSILKLVANISENIGRLSIKKEQKQSIHLRKINQIRTIQGTLAIEGNKLSKEQITAIISGKRVIAPIKEVTEAHNALSAYDKLSNWKISSSNDLLSAHKILMMGLIDQAGMYRTEGVGVMSGDKVVHMAPQANRVPLLMEELLNWLKITDSHPLIASCVFHYELEFIHPFSDGNGRIGRLWQTLILSQWQSVFINIPVESLIHQHQDKYYQAIQKSTANTNCSPFIEFMLNMILEAMNDGVNDAVNEGVKLDKKDYQIIKLILKTPNITKDQLVKITGLSKSTIERRIRNLKTQKLLERIGSDKTGYWNIIKS